MNILSYYIDFELELNNLDSNNCGHFDIAFKLNKKPDYVLKSDIPTDHVTTSQLTTKLNDYALKSDIPEPVDLNGYRQKNDLSHSHFVDLEISYTKEGDEINKTYLHPLDRNNFHEKCPEKVFLKGNFNNSNNETVEFDLEFKNDNENIENESWSCNINDKYSLLWCYSSDLNWKFCIEVFEIETENDCWNINFERAEILVSDELALKSEIEKLKAENAELKLQIEKLTPKLPWQEFYHDFNERVEYIEHYNVSSKISFNISNFAELNISFDLLYGEYLLIFEDFYRQLHYIRIDLNNSKAYLDEIYTDIETKIYDIEDNLAYFEPSFSLKNYETEKDYAFDYVFKKP